MTLFVPPWSKRCVRLEKKNDLSVALRVSGQQHGELVILDRERRIIRNAKPWNDTETASDNAELVIRLAGGEDAVVRQIGTADVPVGYTLPSWFG